jgi:hypothetical protein
LYVDDWIYRVKLIIMDNILSFNNFYNDSAIDLNDIFSLNENGSGVKYSKDEFKKIFEGPLNESGYMDESLVDSSYAYYELSMLYESKSNWMETEGKFIYLDCDTHVILIKNGEGHMLEKSTFDLSKQTLASGLWSDIENKWLSLKKGASSEIKEIAKNQWDLISYGAKKAWEFAKTCANAAVVFAKGLSFLDWVGITLSILAAVISICGTIAAGSVVFAEIEPILQEYSALMMLINGCLSIYEGSSKLNDTTAFLNKNHDLTNNAKIAATAVEVLPDYIMGLGMLCLGSHNLVEAGAAAAFDPTASTRALVGNTGIKSALIETGENLAKKGGAIERTIEGFAKYVTKSEIGIKIGSTLIEMVVGMFGSMVLSNLMGSIWKNLLISMDVILAGISSLLSIPKMITKSINSFTKSANTTFTKILAKGLSAVVKPMTNAASIVIGKYIQPIVDSSRKWITKSFKTYQASVKYLEKRKDGDEVILASIKKAPVAKNVKLPPNRIAPQKQINPNNVTKKDLNLIRKSQDSRAVSNPTKKKSNNKDMKPTKSNESLTYNMIHIKPFII